MLLENELDVTDREQLNHSPAHDSISEGWPDITGCVVFGYTVYPY